MDGRKSGTVRVLQTQRAGLRIARVASRVPLLACFAAAGCIAAAPAVGGDPVDKTGTASAVTVATAEVPKDLVATAISDAARRAAVARDDVAVVEAGPVTWPDGAFGCPQPGMTYTQALVPGYRIVLRAAGKDMHYHVGGKGGPTFCPPERVAPPASRGGDRI